MNSPLPLAGRPVLTGCRATDMSTGTLKSVGKRGRRRSRPSQLMSEVNVTPFVDVMMVLLIIFMVAAPLSIVGIPVELPETNATALLGDEEEPLTVTITIDGQVMIQETETSQEVLVQRLQAIAAERESNKIFLRADGRNDWNRVAEIMGLLNAGGFSNIGLVTDLPGPAPHGADG